MSIHVDMSQSEEPKKKALQELVELLEELKRMGIKSIDVVERPGGVGIVVGNVEYIFDVLDIDDVQIWLVSHGYVVHREYNTLHVE
jgi:hypothetical protein